tara:strand:- start:83 stop:349 length:267 start_codon:yes stop_codon:yes gene_type:complete
MSKSLRTNAMKILWITGVTKRKTSPPAPVDKIVAYATQMVAEATMRSLNIDDNNKLTNDNCVYYTAGLGRQKLNKSGSSYTDINSLRM